MLEYYNNLVKTGQIKADAAQEEVARELEVLSRELTEYAKPVGLLGRVIGKKPIKPKGLFIYGKVGRGKSMLMDAFYKSLPVTEKKRVHFHEFMQAVHGLLHEARSKVIEGRDVVSEVAKQLAEGVKALCFDEYEVNDVTDAMILSKLFKAMAESGVVFVFTSNKRPEDHYKEGLQRQSYVEFCVYLNTQIKILSLDAKRDYRLNREMAADNYFIPADYESTQKLKERFKSISAEALKKIELEVQGRKILLRAAGHVAFADFNELCGQPLGNADYIEIATRFDVLFLEGIPKMNEDLRNEARRFINLIDILYEHKVLLIASADAPPEELYAGNTAGFEFNRTISRLKEMQSWKRRRADEERLD